jgi:hypothetical protein
MQQQLARESVDCFTTEITEVAEGIFPVSGFRYPKLFSSFVSFMVKSDRFPNRAEI